MSTTRQGAVQNGADAERISGLIDGELHQAEVEALLTALTRDSRLQQCWRELHLAGDALRSSEVGAWHADRFCQRVSAALASEPTVLAPRSTRVSLRRWAMPAAALAASLAAVAFVALPLLEQPSVAPMAAAPIDPPVAPAVQASPEVAQVQMPPRRLAPGAGMEVYLTAHRELTGGTAMPRAVHYLRPAAAEER